ncbi:MAG: hypothetical protein R3261_04075 [Alphaproteobacteria bacterium]|nr:hypothetical protein [Alphaproteobacteria bacterium]
MTSSIVFSSIDVALWFAEQARKEDMYLQPQKLQRILYIAYGSYAALHHGRKLMPAIFVVDDTGPVEPNVYRMLELGPPKGDRQKLPPEVEHFLSNIWRKYCHHSTEYLNEQIRKQRIYKEAIKRGKNEEIPHRVIARFFTGEDQKKIQKSVVAPDGRKLAKWVPGSKAASKPTNKS